MGYRSQVTIGFKKETFTKFVGKNKEYFKDCDQILEDKENVIFVWEHVKWYDNYEDVKGIMKVVEDAIEGCPKCGVGFMRVGEEAGDIESTGEPYEFSIYSNTVIEIPELDSVKHDDFFACNTIKIMKE